MGPRPGRDGQLYATVPRPPLSTVPSARPRHGVSNVVTGRGRLSPGPLVRSQRLAIFTAVGGLCFSVQFGVLWTLVRASLGPAWACNALAFLLSAQLNCALSQRFTWKDRCQVSQTKFWRKLGPYNLIALLSLGVNTVAFLAAKQLTHSLLVAQAAGVALGMGFTYLCCNNLLFREKGLGQS